MEDIIRKLIEKIGEDPEREGLKDTPKRVKQSYEFLMAGYNQNIEEIINNATFEENCNDMIIVKDIEFYSMCEHHMLPFFGKCHIGYVPQGKVLGVSKLARVVEVFSRRLQLQERLTRQISETIRDYITPEGVGVVMEAQHLCMVMRGVQKQHSKMVTSSMLGSFRREHPTRHEFLNLINSSLAPA